MKPIQAGEFFMYQGEVCQVCDVDGEIYPPSLQAESYTGQLYTVPFSVATENRYTYQFLAEFWFH